MHPNYTMGRGKVFVGGRHIGDTPSVKVAPDAIHFNVSDISDDNLELFFSGDTADVVYVANNPHGRNIDFTVEAAEISAVPSELKGDEWSTLGFVARGKVSHTVRPTD